MTDYQLITNTKDLHDFCTNLTGAAFLCVDFEFMRENSYYSQLCLVQLATPDVAVIVDPLADGIDLSPLLRLFADESLLKVFHAGGQDIEIIVDLMGDTPKPVFDTQVAAMALGLGEQVGYQNLIGTLLGIQIDKGARFTDWSRRPLDQRQLDYAIGDVTHLAKAFPKMLAALRDQQRGDWLDEEMARLTDRANYITDPQDAWKRLKLPSRDLKVLGRFQALAAWREIEAKDKNLPRGRIIKDETLADLASHPPKQQSDLAKVRGLSERWANNDIGERLMAVIEQAGPLPKHLAPDRHDGPRLDKNARLAADLLKLLLKICCEEADIASRLVCRADDLERLAAGDRNLPLLEGWRYTLFGAQALALVEGRLSFRLEHGRLVIETRQGTAEAVSPTAMTAL